MASKDEAEQALYGGIVAAANAAKENQDGTLLKTAAEAFREVAHGPQGGSYGAEQANTSTNTTTNTSTSTSTSTSKQSYTGQSDYHETHHRDGEPRHPPGFGGS